MGVAPFAHLGPICVTSKHHATTTKQIMIQSGLMTPLLSSFRYEEKNNIILLLTRWFHSEEQSCSGHTALTHEPSLVKLCPPSDDTNGLLLSNSFFSITSKHALFTYNIHT